MPASEPGHGRYEWIRRLRRHHEAALVVGDRAVPVRFVIDGATGRLALCVEGWVVEAVDGVLFVPEERADALQLMVEFDQGDAPGAAQDRWSAYHGEPRARHWGSARIVGVRCEGEVCDELDLAPVNPLRAGETRLLKMINAQTPALALVCERYAGVRVPAPFAVGIDPFGIDVRVSCGIVRVEFPSRLAPAEAGVDSHELVAEVIRAILADAAPGGEPGSAA